MSKNMVIVRELNKKEEICFLLEDVLEMNKENSELAFLFSKIVEINNKGEKYHVAYVENNGDEVKDYFNSLLAGKQPLMVEKGTLVDFVFKYIKTNFPKYTNICGLTVADKAKLIISANERNNAKGR